MFESFLSFWKQSDILSVAYKEVGRMLLIAKNMYYYSMNVLLEGQQEKRDLYKEDQELNKLQIDVRRKVLEHLAISPNQDITPSLVLISIIIDIERIGDYSKNLLELSHKYPEKMEGTYVKEIIKLKKVVDDNFEKTIEAFTKCNKELGKKVMESHAEIAKKCEAIVERLVDDPHIGSRLGIIYALLARYLKRVSAHLKNVSSSVVNPFHRLGYRPEGN